MTINEWAEDFKSYVNELQMPKDDYKGIMSYIDDALELLKEQKPISITGSNSYEEYWDREAICPDCGTHWMSYDKNEKRVTKYCPGCGRSVKWNV